MQPYCKGDIVLIPFPFTDSSGVKVRPALVLAAPKKSADIVLVFITSQLKTSFPHTVTVSPCTENGLKTKSHIICSKLATLDKKVALGLLGTIDSNTLQQVDRELRTVLSL